MSINSLPLQLSTLSAIGLVGSMFKSYTEHGFDPTEVISSIIWQILFAFVVSVIILWFLKTQEATFLKQPRAYMIIFTWIYFTMGLISILRLVSQ